ncbi:hypothetical protein ILUMI_27233, partial [Ignelater luminosus]
GRESIENDLRGRRPTDVTNSDVCRRTKAIVLKDRGLKVPTIIRALTISESSVLTAVSKVLLSSVTAHPRRGSCVRACIPPLAGRLTAVVFYDWRGIILIEYIPNGTTITDTATHSKSQKINHRIVLILPHLNVFRLFKEHLRRRRFANDNELKEIVGVYFKD